MLLVELFIEVGVFVGVFNVVYGGKDQVDILLNYFDIVVVFFVGFVLVGQYIYCIVIDNMKCVQCFVGVKNYMVVMFDVNKNYVINNLVGVFVGVVG